MYIPVKAIARPLTFIPFLKYDIRSAKQTTSNILNFLQIKILTAKLYKACTWNVLINSIESAQLQ